MKIKISGERYPVETYINKVDRCSFPIMCSINSYKDFYYYYYKD